MKTALKSPNDDNRWFDIADNEYATKTLRALGDDVKMVILTSFIDTPRTINEILRMHHISHTSGYRKAKSLIDDGLLVSTNISQTERGKSVNTYIPIFKNLIIMIVKNKVIIRIQFNNTVRNRDLLPPLIDKLEVANKIHFSL